jgi:hypothetical protein
LHLVGYYYHVTFDILVIENIFQDSLKFLLLYRSTHPTSQNTVIFPTGASESPNPKTVHLLTLQSQIPKTKTDIYRSRSFLLPELNFSASKLQSSPAYLEQFSYAALRAPRECLLLLGVESFVFQVAIQKLKD